MEVYVIGKSGLTMLDLKQIELFYPENLKPFKRNILREYLQYKILEIIYDSTFGEKLVFMGGTASRIVHENTRFSEDLDFDGRDLSPKEFEQLTKLVQKKLEGEGYPVEIRNVIRTAFTCNIKIPGLLFDYHLTGHRAEKILIKINTEPQHFDYQPEKMILNKFDVFTRINVVPVDILLAQKIYAIFGRRRTVGRDFYDMEFLLGKTRPNMDYLRLKIKIKDKADLKKRLLEKCQKLDFKKLAQDLEQFLFVPTDSKKVLYFYEYIKEIDF